MGWCGRYRGVLVGSEVSHQHPLGASWGPPHRFNMGDMTGQYEILKTPVFTGISTFSRHRWRFALSSPRAQLRHEMPPRRQVAHVKPNLRPNVPTLRHVGPSWAKLEPTTGPSSGQVRPKFGPSGSCSAQLTGKDGQVWPQSALVGPSPPAPIYPYPFPGRGRFSSRSDSNYFKPI